MFCKAIDNYRFTGHSNNERINPHEHHGYGQSSRPRFGVGEATWGEGNLGVGGTHDCHRPMGHRGMFCPVRISRCPGGSRSRLGSGLVHRAAHALLQGLGTVGRVGRAAGRLGHGDCHDRGAQVGRFSHLWLMAPDPLTTTIVAGGHPFRAYLSQSTRCH